MESFFKNVVACIFFLGEMLGLIFTHFSKAVFSLSNLLLYRFRLFLGIRKSEIEEIISYKGRQYYKTKQANPKLTLQTLEVLRKRFYAKISKKSSVLLISDLVLSILKSKRITSLFSFRSLLPKNKREEILGDFFEIKESIIQTKKSKIKIRMELFKLQISILYNLYLRKALNWIAQQFKVSK